MSTRPQTRLERWLGTPETPLEAGSGTDDVTDPEPWDTVEGERPTGDLRGTFPQDPQQRTDGGREPVRPVLIERPETVRPVQPRGWRAGSTSIGVAGEPTRILSTNPDRAAGWVRNDSPTETVLIGPDHGPATDPSTSIALKPGQRHTFDHTGPVWVGPYPGALAGASVTYSEQLWTGWT